MNVELRSEARDDLVDAAVFYHEQKDGLGDHFIKSIYDDLKLLEAQAGIHELVYGLHRKLSKRFPYAIYYNVHGNIVDVVAILDCRRNPRWTKSRIENRTKNDAG